MGYGGGSGCNCRCQEQQRRGAIFEDAVRRRLKHVRGEAVVVVVNLNFFWYTVLSWPCWLGRALTRFEMWLIEVLLHEKSISISARFWLVVPLFLISYCYLVSS